MEPITIRLKKMREGAVVPAYATEGAAAVDLSAAIETPLTLRPGERRLIPTGIAIALPAGHVAILAARSGLAAKKGITSAGGIGVIDADYRGEIFFSAINLSDTPVEIPPGERICQLMVLPVCPLSFTLTEHLPETARGEGGFGSTGTGITEERKNKP